MLILALDTASEQLAIALAEVEENGWHVLARNDAPAPRCANQRLVPRAKALLEEAGIEPSDLQAVVCGRGPGSFTGVRIGIATAKGIASGLRVPLHGVSTTDAVAEGLFAAGVRGLAGVFVDAMRKEVYPVRYRLDDSGAHRLDLDTVCKPAEVAERWAQSGDEPITVAGNGLVKYRDVLESAFTDAGRETLLTIASEELWLPTGSGLVAAFFAAKQDGTLDSGDASSLLPIYTRLSDAEENERKRASSEVPASGVADGRAMPGLMLRPMTRADIAHCVLLENEAFSDTPADVWSAGMLADELPREDRTWWVAAENGQLVGVAGGWLVDGACQVLQVAVLPQHRREGIAARLLRRIAADALDLGASSITLEVRADNTAAQALYASLGLKSIGTRPHYYPGGEDALIMTGALPLAEASTASATGEGCVAGMTLADASAVNTVHEEARPLILAIESSCDETACAIIGADEVMHADVIASQVGFHARFGGVVPEIASRKHTEAIVGVCDEALRLAGADIGKPGLDYRDLDAIAVTTRPGLVGALVVGLAFAKGLALATGLPLIEVNHLEGHIYANRLIDKDVKPPMVALLVSGGHTMLVHVKDWGVYETLGSTLDDAVGEAFDKVAKALGLGYPGGPILSKLAADGNPAAIDFPRAMLHSHDYRFSLSGLKTAVITYINGEREAGRDIDVPDLAASFQQAVIDVQVAKATTAVEETGVSDFVIGGGVAANPALRDALVSAMDKLGVRTTLPSLAGCTDNAGMVAAVALTRFEQGKFAPLDCDVCAHAPLDEAY